MSSVLKGKPIFYLREYKQIFKSDNFETDLSNTTVRNISEIKFRIVQCISESESTTKVFLEHPISPNQSYCHLVLHLRQS